MCTNNRKGYDRHGKPGAGSFVPSSIPEEGFEVHHIIPKEIYGMEKFRNLEGSIPCNESENLIDLYSHRGSHPNYTADVIRMLAQGNDPQDALRDFLARHDQESRGQDTGYRGLDNMLLGKKIEWEALVKKWTSR